jgi:hypothetical protein
MVAIKDFGCGKLHMGAAEAARLVGLGFLFDHEPECLIGLRQAEVAAGDTVFIRALEPAVVLDRAGV